MLGRYARFTSPRREPSTGSDHCSAGIRRRVFGHHSSSLLPLAAALPHATGSPGLGVLRRLRPTRALQPATRLSPHRGAGAGGSHVHCCSVNGRGARLCPCGFVMATPQTVTTTCRTRHMPPFRQFPTPTAAWLTTTKGRVRTAHQPRSTGFELVDDEEALRHRFLAYTFPSCSPGTARPVVPNRPDFVAAAPIHPRRSPRADCRQLHPAAATAKRCRSLTSIRNNSASWRTMCSSTPSRVTPSNRAGSSAAACRTGRIVFHTVRQPQPS